MLVKITWQRLAPKWPILLLIVLAQALQTIAGLALPSLNAAIIDEGVLKADIPAIWRLGAWMLGLSVVQSIITALAVYFGALLSMDLGAQLRKELFTRVSSFGAVELHRFSPPSLITRATNDVQQIQMVVLMTLTLIIMTPIMGVGAVIMAIRQDLKLSGIFLVAVPVLMAVIAVLMVKLAPLFRTQQERIDRINTVLREQLQGVRVIRAFVQQKNQAKTFGQANDELRNTALSIGFLFAIMFPALSLIIGVSSVSILGFGGVLIDAGDMQVGSLIAFLAYLMQIFMSIMIAAMLFFMVPRAEVCSERIHEVLDTDPSIAPPAPDMHHNLPPAPRLFRLQNAGVQYEGADAPVLQGIDLEFLPGTTTAIIGSTGSGKTTLVNTLPRLVDLTQGSLTVNGIDVRHLDPDSLRRCIALVPQKAYLFSGTIATTVSGLANPDKDCRGRIVEALKAAQAWEFVSAFDDGIDHVVEAGGQNYSGGQRQRLTIARALYRQADLYVFDDSFSALDYATDAALRAGLRQAVGDGAVLVVAQRVSTIRHASTIIVLEGGRIVGRGTHCELLENCETYQEIVSSQLSAEEAA
ncbi:MAG: ABC transporter ATP-binding protein [Actinomycetaceae bacterium]|nr:ABC transporter ATP-binding protein [Actinomycetaceae bacterium]